MELFNSNIKKLVIFFLTEGFSYISGNENSEKIPYISGNGNSKKLLIFQKLSFRAQKVKRTHS